MTDIPTNPKASNVFVTKVFADETPQEWIDNQVLIDRELNQLEQAMITEQRNLFQSLQTNVIDTFRQKIAIIVENHQQIYETLTKPLTDKESPQQRVERYRNEVRGAVFLPISDQVKAKGIATFSSDSPAKICIDQWAEMRQTLLLNVNHFPENAVVPEAENLYKSSKYDPPYHSVGKAKTRFTRGVNNGWRFIRSLGRKIIRKESLAPIQYGQILAGRKLVNWHLQMRFPKMQRQMYAEILSTISNNNGRLERDLTEWLKVFLDLSQAVNEENAYKSVITHAEKLKEWFRSLKSPDLMSEFAERAENMVYTAMDALRSDFRRAGTFLLPGGIRFLPPKHERETFFEHDLAIKWQAWDDNFSERMRLNQALLDLRIQFSVLQNRLLDQIEHQVIEASDQTLKEAEKTLLSLQKTTATATFSVENVTDWLTSATNLFEGEISEVFAGRPCKKVIEKGADKLLATVRKQPYGFTVNVLQPTGMVEVVPTIGTRKVAFRELTEQAVDLLMIEELRVQIDPLILKFAELREQVKQVEHVVLFNLKAALDELQKDEVTDQNRFAAQELTLTGLERALASLAVISETLAQSERQTITNIQTVYQKIWQRFFDRIKVEVRVQEQLMDLWTEVIYSVRISIQSATKKALKIWGRLGVWTQELLGVARSALRLGQSVVSGEVDMAASMQSLEAVEQVDSFLAELPLVYRRLFAFKPITDEVLFAGRRKDVKEIQIHYDRWKRDIGHALVMVGSQGAGATSLFNYVEKTIFPEAKTVRVTLTDRILNPMEVVRVLADALDIPPASASTFSQLADTIEGQYSSTQQPIVCIVEHLEHLLIRAVGGTDCTEQLFSFFSRTDIHVFWMASISPLGRLLIEKGRPAAADLVHWNKLENLDESTIEELILNRHRRSGLRMFFQANLGKYKTQQKIKAVKREALNESEKTEQAKLQAAWFDNLHDLTAGNIMLALFYWLRSIRLDKNNSILYVEPLTPLNFSFLSRFNLLQAFTLKALLEHSTLTIGEHKTIFNTEQSESYELFQGLANYKLIQPIVADKSASVVQDEVRYKLRPLVVFPVEKHLAGRNMIH